MFLDWNQINEEDSSVSGFRQDEGDLSELPPSKISKNSSVPQKPLKTTISPDSRASQIIYQSIDKQQRVESQDIWLFVRKPYQCQNLQQFEKVFGNFPEIKRVLPSKSGWNLLVCNKYQAKQLISNGFKNNQISFQFYLSKKNFELVSKETKSIKKNPKSQTKNNKIKLEQQKIKKNQKYIEKKIQILALNQQPTNLKSIQNQKPVQIQRPLSIQKLLQNQKPVQIQKSLSIQKLLNQKSVQTQKITISNVKKSSLIVQIDKSVDLFTINKGKINPFKYNQQKLNSLQKENQQLQLRESRDQKKEIPRNETDLNQKDNHNHCESHYNQFDQKYDSEENLLNMKKAIKRRNKKLKKTNKTQNNPSLIDFNNPFSFFNQ